MSDHQNYDQNRSVGPLGITEWGWIALLAATGIGAAVLLLDSNRNADAEFERFIHSTNPPKRTPLYTERPKWNSGLTIEDYDSDFERRYFQSLTAKQKEEYRQRIVERRKKDEEERAERMRELFNPTPRDVMGRPIESQIDLPPSWRR